MESCGGGGAPSGVEFTDDVASISEVAFEWME